VDLCVEKAIDNLRQLHDFYGVPTELLMRILPHCTLQQLTRIENRTQVGE
jgi:elongin-A